MTRILTDAEIMELLTERKRLPQGWRSQLEPKRKSDTRYAQKTIKVIGDAAHEFALTVRTSVDFLTDFSVILSLVENGHEYNLVRHNGNHKADHTNTIEKRQGLPNSILRNAFHIHQATQRYQESGRSIDSYAEATSLYNTLDGALDLMVSSYGFVIEAAATFLPLFDVDDKK
ncbi:MAG TPA: hypothetical protein VHB50_21570 [Bryobacteraceae bacterium]|nr:hypothetical protein [Bryobacteraceae bacterium]